MQKQVTLLAIFLVLPSTLFAAEVEHINCPDGSSCPFGQACQPHGSSGQFQCASLSQQELDNRKLVIGEASPFPNTSLSASSADQAGSCPYTSCYKYTSFDKYCCLPTQGNVKYGVCCPAGNTCCPQKTQCCSDGYGLWWCCKQRAVCGLSYMYCYGGAGNVSPAAAVMAFLLAVLASKYFAEV